VSQKDDVKPASVDTEDKPPKADDLSELTDEDGRKPDEQQKTGDDVSKSDNRVPEEMYKATVQYFFIPNSFSLLFFLIGKCK